MARTTREWWKDVSNDPEKMVEWLKKQYHGEVTAEARIRSMIDKYGLKGKEAYIIRRIADDERKHAEWVKQILHKRGIPAEILDKEERYWNETLPAAEDKSFSYMCAVGYLAESMRLDRIKLLASDKRFADIAVTFNMILADERYHAYAFKTMTTPEDIEQATPYHNSGLNALGLAA